MTNQEAYEIMCDKVDKYDKMMCVLQEIITELREYQNSLSNGQTLEKDGWQNTFYDGIEYAIDVVVDYDGDIKKNHIPIEALQELRQEIEKKQTYKLFLGSPDLYIDRDSTLEILDEYIKEYTGS